jgi:hypothetical protein
MNSEQVLHNFLKFYEELVGAGRVTRLQRPQITAIEQFMAWFEEQSIMVDLKDDGLLLINMNRDLGRTLRYKLGDLIEVLAYASIDELDIELSINNNKNAVIKLRNRNIDTESQK